MHKEERGWLRKAREDTRPFARGQRFSGPKQAWVGPLYSQIWIYVLHLTQKHGVLCKTIYFKDPLYDFWKDLFYDLKKLY